MRVHVATIAIDEEVAVAPRTQPALPLPASVTVGLLDLLPEPLFDGPLLEPAMRFALLADCSLAPLTDCHHRRIAAGSDISLSGGQGDGAVEQARVGGDGEPDGHRAGRL